MTGDFLKKLFFISIIVLLSVNTSEAQLWKKPLKKTVFLSLEGDLGFYQIADQTVGDEFGTNNLSTVGGEIGLNFAYYFITWVWLILLVATSNKRKAYVTIFYLSHGFNFSY